jgi:dTMP kinase
VTVLLDLEPKLGLERAAATGAPDRLERADLEFHRAVRAGFLALAEAEPERFLTIDATRPPLEIHEWILAAVTGSLEGM